MTPPAPTAFGRRIMICGTSNTGKSTLAVALSRRLGLPVVHLDQLRFLPGTDWQERPDDAFAALHDASIAGEDWIIEGNYSRLMPQRMARATGIIMLRDNRFSSFGRYVWRTLFQKDRAGALEGNRDSLKWEMANWILIRAPRNVSMRRKRLAATGLPLLDIGSMRQLRRLYRDWGLER